jgi:threonine dehydratase
VASLPPDERARGVVAFSSGNHAQAVALAARLHGVPAVIVMPADAPPGKLAATRGYGAEVVLYERRTADREAIARAVALERGSTLIPPYDLAAVIAGQGTVGLELVEDAGPVDVLVACCSGGGLAAGCGVALQALHPATRLVVVEPAAGDDTARSLAAGHRVRVPQPRTIADGLAVQTPGELTFPLLQALGAEAVSVTEDELATAVLVLFERTKQVVEPSGAAGVAALLAGKVPGVAGRRVGVTLSGGNVGPAAFAALLNGG